MAISLFIYSVPPLPLSSVNCFECDREKGIAIFIFCFLCFSLSINLYENQSNDHFFFSLRSFFLSLTIGRLQFMRNGAPTHETQEYTLCAQSFRKEKGENKCNDRQRLFSYLVYEMSIVVHVHQQSNDQVKVFRNFECWLAVGAFFLCFFIFAFTVELLWKGKGRKIVDCCQPALVTANYSTDSCIQYLLLCTGAAVAATVTAVAALSQTDTWNASFAALPVWPCTGGFCVQRKIV